MKTALLGQLAVKIAGVVDPLLEPIRRLVAETVIRFRNWRFKRRGFKVRHVRPTWVPEHDSANNILIVPDTL